MTQHQSHWTEKLWKELDSISVTQQSIEGILASQNLSFIPTNNWTTNANKPIIKEACITKAKQKNHDRFTSCTTTNANSKAITTKSKNQKEDIKSNENFSTLIHQSFVFSEFEEEKEIQYSMNVGKDEGSKLTTDDDDSDDKIDTLPPEDNVSAPTPKTKKEAKVHVSKEKKKVVDLSTQRVRLKNNNLHHTNPPVSSNENTVDVKHDNDMKGMNRCFSTKAKPTDTVNNDHFPSNVQVGIGASNPIEDEMSNQGSLYKIVPVSSSSTKKQINQDCNSNQFDHDRCHHDVIQLLNDDNTSHQTEHQTVVSNESWKKYLASIASSSSLPSVAMKNDCENLQRIQDFHLCEKVSTFCDDEYSEVTMVDSIHCDYNRQEGML